MDNKITDMLDKPLLIKHVSQRTQSGMSLSYIEGHHVIREANRIFGYDGWSVSVESLSLTHCGENAKGNQVVSAQALVVVSALGCTRHDVGYGSGVAKSIADANEGAGKEAVTDAMKRAFRTFGDQFGNALYDKAQKHVVDKEPMAGDVVAAFESAKSKQELQAIWNKLNDHQKNKYRNDLDFRLCELE